jgi:hypothetical protein
MRSIGASSSRFEAAEQSRAQRRDVTRFVVQARRTSYSVDAAATLAATRELLRNPLSVDDAVQVALLNNAGLKASLAELGIGEADLVQASRLPNPRFTFSNRRNSEITTIDRTVMISVMSWRPDVCPDPHGRIAVDDCACR